MQKYGENLHAQHFGQKNFKKFSSARFKPTFDGFIFLVIYFIICMLRSLLVVGLCCLNFFSNAQPTSTNTVTSPQEFLGYRIGERYTPHHRVLAYAEQVARQVPGRVRVIPYGTTYEGRPLAIVVVASEANMNRLEEIRTDNLKRIGMAEGNPASATQTPIAWLSYNVHGNEAVSSETFMEVLYGLVDPQKGSDQPAVMQKILNSTVVILDPDLNPDGHDRYVNWYNQMQGRVADPTPFAREHNEPWPGGRYTHYYFDPNRDWAWQTQEVTQQRMAMYHRWMPHVHGDFHEMGVESPYYFAPSAKPYHEDITPFQRDFQNVIGQYCSRYFDRNGWLYYTRERFDLFYPSYGDTWPTYNGAIAMTYEQGGNTRAGLAITKADGDTLTLRQRIDHHTAASIATLESVADRGTDIVKAFGEFYDKARTSPIGAYKSYVIKANGDAGRMNALRQLLDKNQIRYGYGRAAAAATTGKSRGNTNAGGLSGFNYFTQKTESGVAVAPEDLVISAYQPKSTLLKILFEPKSALEDSVTYDITAWSLPYAFGLTTYGLTTRLEPASTVAPASVPASTSQTTGATPYAYLVRWQSMPSAQLLAGLLKQKLKVRAAEKPFELGGQSYPAGTLLITRAGNERLGARFDQIVQAEAQKANVTLTPVQTGFVTKGSDFGSDFVMALKAPRVGVVVGEGMSPTASGEVWHYFDQELQYPSTLITGNDLASIDLSKLDVLVMPTGYTYGRILNDKTLSALKTWVQAGGKLIALERAADALAGKDGFELKEKPDKEKDAKKDDKTKKSATDSVKTYADRERDAVSDETPGSIYRITLDATHPLAFGLGNSYYAIVQDAHNFELLKDGWNVGYLKDDNYVAGFAGSNAKEKLKNTLSMGVQSLGRGSVVYLADNPLFRGFWYSGKLLFANAVFMVGN
ncbi:zinc carboxypeptidase [Rudanella paleaurantiibacter]|uniref:Zinc carboxypeptidase n=2 Tax=Rudanella paleaurantiibacter TaxID=2614655 RepID=A0A7J5U147_9BACT|nr:zinc carboxypeptidase [Rudanella paleaurantiibacter]